LCIDVCAGSWSAASGVDRQARPVRVWLALAAAAPAGVRERHRQLPLPPALTTSFDPGFYPDNPQLRARRRFFAASGEVSVFRLISAQITKSKISSTRKDHPCRTN
jgi:hypothetical protein